MSLDMQQFHESFFDESAEHLDDMERLLMSVDLDNPDPEDLDSIFRAAHSIKGGSGIFGFDALGAVTHVMENILDRVRDRNMSLDTDLVDLLLSTGDTLRSILDDYRNGREPDWDAVNQASEALEKRLSAETSAESENQEQKGQGYGFYKSPLEGQSERESYGFFDEPSSADSGDDEGFGFFDDEPAEASSEDDGFGFFEDAPGAEPEDDGFGFFDDAPGASGSEPEQPYGNANEAYVASLLGGGDEPAPPTSPSEPAKASPAAGGREDRAESKPSEMPGQKEGGGPADSVASKKGASGKPAESSAKSAGKSSGGKSSGGESSSIRVDIQKVDQLINLVGELVITQSMLMEIGKEVEGNTGERLDRVLGELERNTREMQESVMSVRMLPISFAFSRFPRVVRDLSGKLGKKVELVVEGGETELDKGLIEKLVDPLTHLVRNSIDHGIESPAVRKAAGKPESGTVTLRALQQGGSVVIEVLDDGGGLNRDKILEKAEEKGVEVPSNPSDDEVWSLIMSPGFSTAAEVTEVSGRGVGMDVVKQNLEALGGRIEIRSMPGEGTTFSIHLPLTLAIVDGMGVAVGDQTFIVPLVNILESMAPEPGSVKTLAGEDQLLSVRDQFWPVVQLNRVMQVPNSRCKQPGDGIMVLVETARRRFALQVDELLGQQQVVIKSLEQHYRRVPGVAGATIMGDGSVALILDTEALADLARHDELEETVNEQ